jgi:RimJ/RimL family protein N-acetyltransferase
MEDVIDFVKHRISPSINIPDTWFQWVIINKKNNQIIGDIGVHFLGSENAQVEIGCTLKRDCHGVGFATESLTKVIDYLFHKLNKHRIVASIDPRNTGSVSLVERIGFRKEAHFKESLFLHGEWVDDIVYALLKSEWK